MEGFLNNSIRPYFDGTDYAYWKQKMEKYLDSENVNLWKCIRKPWVCPTNLVDGVVVNKPRDAWTPLEEIAYLKNNKCMSTLYHALSREEGGKILHCQTAKEIWVTLENHHEGTSEVKFKKIQLLTQEYEMFFHKADEKVTEMTNRLLKIVEALRKYGKHYSKADVNSKILRSLPKVTSIEEANDLTKLNTGELIGKLLTFEIYIEREEPEEKKKVLALKAKETKVKETKAKEAKESSYSSDDEFFELDSDGGSDKEMALFTKRYNNYIKRKQDKSKREFHKRPFKKEDVKCYECGKKGHMKNECNNNEKSPQRSHRKDKEVKKRAYKVTWDESSEEDEDYESERANICFMANIEEASSTKVHNDSSISSSSIDDLSTHDHESDSGDEKVGMMKTMAKKVNSYKRKIVKNKEDFSLLEAKINDFQKQIVNLNLQKESLKNSISLLNTSNLTSLNSFKEENEKLKKEVIEYKTSSTKFQKGKQSLDEMLTFQRPSSSKEGLGFVASFSSSPSSRTTFKRAKTIQSSSIDVEFTKETTPSSPSMTKMDVDPPQAKANTSKDDKPKVT
ncbi:uncharacterized protein LOC126661998 [Mercurialis annua]|uniref:uncharacterized protein LOC126661998 n=1 Tax=Mercurialis annua TaxID=3986 RepID=UPI00215F7646|nr:uncharacterized protein LOC126661998 [Mercurialis annua]